MEFSPEQAANPALTSHQLIFFLISQVIVVFTYWVASCLVARKNATVRNALVAYGLTLLSMIGLGFVIGVGTAVASRSGFNADTLNKALIPVLLVFFATCIAVIMKVYRLSVLTGILFFLIQGIISLAAQLLWTPDWSSVRHLSAASLPWVKPAPQPTPDPTAVAASLKARSDDLKRRREQLDIRKRFMPPNDPVAADQYQRDKTALERDAATLAADQAALRTPK
jgi:hypothetical protein